MCYYIICVEMECWFGKKNWKKKKSFGASNIEGKGIVFGISVKIIGLTNILESKKKKKKS